MEGKIVLNNLFNMDANVKAKATAYYRAAKEAEEAMAKYENIKYSIDL
jgi:hypothetical protein